jgi:hypothetical protein
MDILAAGGSVGPGLLDTLVKLVNLGFAGVGIAVLLLVFVILIRDKPADPGNQVLRLRFLSFGMAFAFFCGLVTLAGPWLAPAPVQAKPAAMLLNFSPRFQTEGLPPPQITLSDGEMVEPGKAFLAQGGQVLVSVDDALKSVATLKQTALTLADAASKAQQQADAAVSELAKARDTPAAAPASADQARAETASKQTQQAAASITSAIKAGNYGALEAQNVTLDASTKASLAARTRAIKGM